MEQVYDNMVIAMCQAFVNKDNEDKNCEVIEVHADGHNVKIEYRFPSSLGWKHTEWTLTMLELMAFVWAQTP